MGDASRSSLPPRLAALAGMISAGARVADVGSDHGLLPLALLASGRASFVLATERTPGRMAGIGVSPPEAPWSDRFEVRHGDGLAALRPEDRLDTIVLAGLGGRSIVRILSAGPLVPPHPSVLVLQPRSEAAVLRGWLSANGWRLTAEHLSTERGRRHLTLRAERGDDSDLYRDDLLGREDLLAAGPLLVRGRSDEVRVVWREARERLVRILGSRGTDRAFAPRARAELLLAERVLARLVEDRGPSTSTTA